MDPSRKPVVVVGSINIDLVASAERIPREGETVSGLDFQVHPGGKGANQAVAVARLGYPVRMIGRVGGDDFGQQLRSSLKRAGVDDAGVTTSEGPSGVAVIIVAESGQNSIVVTAGANALLTAADLDAQIEIIRSAGIVLTQLEIPIDTILHLAAMCFKAAIPLVVDPAPARELPAELFAMIDWLTPNETEAAFYLGTESQTAGFDDSAAVARKLLARGGKGLILKLGSRGAYIAATDGPSEMVNAFPISPVDTTAAGDCFNGAFAAGLLMGKSSVESTRFAAAAAAISTTRVGAQPSMPTLQEVEDLMSTTSQ